MKNQLELDILPIILLYTCESRTDLLNLLLSSKIINLMIMKSKEIINRYKYLIKSSEIPKFNNIELKYNVIDIIQDNKKKYFNVSLCFGNFKDNTCFIKDIMTVITKIKNVREGNIIMKLYEEEISIITLSDIEINKDDTIFELSFENIRKILSTSLIKNKTEIVVTNDSVEIGLLYIIENNIEEKDLFIYEEGHGLYFNNKKECRVLFDNDFVFIILEKLTDISSIKCIIKSKSIIFGFQLKSKFGPFFLFLEIDLIRV